MDNVGFSGELGSTGEQRTDALFVAVKLEAHIGASLQRDRRRRNDDFRTVVAAHRVQRYDDFALQWTLLLPLGWAYCPQMRR